MTQIKVALLIAAAGRGRRIGTKIPKAYIPIQRAPILRWCLSFFLDHFKPEAIRVIIAPKDRHLYAQATDGLGLPQPVIGGINRQESVHAGLEALAKLDKPPEYVMIHDAVRPFPTGALLERVESGLLPERGSIPSLPLTDAIHNIDKSSDAGPLNRVQWALAQTPQAFPFNAILEAHRTIAGSTEDTQLPPYLASDDAGIARHAGLGLIFVEGEPSNLKITTAEDLVYAEAWIRRNNLQLNPAFTTSGGGSGILPGREPQVRVLMGYDIHRTTYGVTSGGAKSTRMWLGGVAIPATFSLQGHSDADPVLHALADAMFAVVPAREDDGVHPATEGNSTGGDLGQRFSEKDARWKDAKSSVFVGQAVQELQQIQAKITQVDITIFAEQPKIAPYRFQITSNVASLLSLSTDDVSLKARTQEGLDSIGAGKAIAAQVLVTVMR